MSPLRQDDRQRQVDEQIARRLARDEFVARHPEDLLANLDPVIADALRPLLHVPAIPQSTTERSEK